MSYIPKSAQRKINKYNSKTRAIRLSPEAEKKLEDAFNNRTPAVLRQGQPGAGLWDIYFNGIKQHLCTFASVNEGCIVRYTHGKGSTPLTEQTERLTGCVVIVPKGSRIPAHLIVSPATAADMQKAGIRMAGVEVVEKLDAET